MRDMMQFVFYLFAVWGWTYGLHMSSLFMPARVIFASRSAFAEGLIYCPYCTGFWMAWIIALAGFAPTQLAEALNFDQAFRAAFVATGALLLARAAFPALLSMPKEQYDGERELVEELSARRAARGDDASGTGS
jgi:hypothetical protein